MTWSRIKKMTQQILHLGDSPSRTALAFAIGVFIAFSPLYGLHTISVLVCAWAFRLNVVAIHAGSLINNPWTLLPILGTTMWVGLRLVPVGAATPLAIGEPPPVAWGDFTLQMLWHQFQPFFLPFVVGATVLGIVCSLIAYPLLLFGIRRYHDTQRRLSAALAASLRDETK
jgi:uncharacterized protein (DUF2062 family)